jgi:hypothetical protein
MEIHDFSKHKAKFKIINENLELIEFKEPKTNIYAVNYLLNKKEGILFVFGDLCTSAYNYYRKIDWNNFKKPDLQYISSKCTSSEFGKFYKKFTNKKFKEDILENIKQIYDFDGIDDKDIDNIYECLEINDIDNIYELNDWFNNNFWFFNLYFKEIDYHDLITLIKSQNGDSNIELDFHYNEIIKNSKRQLDCEILDYLGITFDSNFVRIFKALEMALKKVDIKKERKKHQKSNEINLLKKIRMKLKFIKEYSHLKKIRSKLLFNFREEHIRNNDLRNELENINKKNYIKTKKFLNYEGWLSKENNNLKLEIDRLNLLIKTYKDSEK